MCKPLLTTSAFLFLLSSLVGCASIENYIGPSRQEPYSILLPFGLVGQGSRYVQVLGVDRKEVPIHIRGSRIPEDTLAPLKALGFDREVKQAVLLHPGTRRLQILACESSFNLIINLGGSQAFKCAQVVLRIEAVDGEIYQVMGTVSKDKDFAEIWVERVAGNEVVAGPIRVAGLKTR